jgi:hypothetical protein
MKGLREGLQTLSSVDPGVLRDKYQIEKHFR